MSQDDDKSDQKVSTKIETKKTTNSTPKINQVGRNNLVKQYTDPGYVESSFPTSSSFWIMILKKDYHPTPRMHTQKLFVSKPSKTTTLKVLQLQFGNWVHKKNGMARCY